MVTGDGRPWPGDREGLPGQRLAQGAGATQPDPAPVHPDPTPAGAAVHPAAVDSVASGGAVASEAVADGGVTGAATGQRGAAHSAATSARAAGVTADARLGALRRLGLLTVAMALLTGLLVWLYGTSVTSLRPRNLPILTVGAQPAAGALADQISRVEPGALSVRTVGSVAAADRALRDREAYAAIVIGDGGLTLRVASAASPAVTEALTRGIRVFMPGLEIPVVDVVPTAPRDVGGGGLAAGYLPLVLVLAAAGVLLTRLVRSRAVRLAGIALFAVLAGFAGAVALRGALHVLPGSLLTTMAVVTLLALAVVAPVVGAGAVGGTAGLVGIALVMVVAAALSAAASAPEMLPRPWGDVGQFAPPGAGVTLLRSTDYFDGAAGGRPVVVLAVWLVLGLWLAFVGERGAQPAATAWLLSGGQRPIGGQRPLGGQRPTRAAHAAHTGRTARIARAGGAGTAPSGSRTRVGSPPPDGPQVPVEEAGDGTLGVPAADAGAGEAAGPGQATAVPGRRSTLERTVPLEPPPASGSTRR
ncbi:ABC transporter permease [Frankia sp. Ag45/Mut15]|uniref:ABC transporter permease n=1 Tax=Frankia umida TaxID=573489 RepID=A0ABT0K0R9_9ACTN|nr:ABC transporter permease [Frankia umida]MCK9877381.1 ABC transporter permease [Frankia umida]